MSIGKEIYERKVNLIKLNKGERIKIKHLSKGKTRLNDMVFECIMEDKAIFSYLDEFNPNLFWVFSFDVFEDEYYRYVNLKKEASPRLCRWINYPESDNSEFYKRKLFYRRYGR